jgi:hypothetical protein
VGLFDDPGDHKLLPTTANFYQGSHAFPFDVTRLNSLLQVCIEERADASARVLSRGSWYLASEILPITTNSVRTSARWWLLRNACPGILPFVVVERTTEHVPAVVAMALDERWVAGLTDDARAMTTAFRADRLKRSAAPTAEVSEARSRRPLNSPAGFLGAVDAAGRALLAWLPIRA